MSNLSSAVPRPRETHHGYSHYLYTFTMNRWKRAKPEHKAFWAEMFRQAGMTLAGLTRLGATLH